MHDPEKLISSVEGHAKPFHKGCPFIISPMHCSESALHQPFRRADQSSTPTYPRGSGNGSLTAFTAWETLPTLAPADCPPSVGGCSK